MKILVVEDEGLILLLIEEALVRGGYEVRVSSSGREAIRLIDDPEQEFAGIVCDIRLGDDVSGWDVARRGRERKADMAIVYISADSGGEWPTHGVPESMFVPKPFAESQIVTAMATLLNKVG